MWNNGSGVAKQPRKLARERGRVWWAGPGRVRGLNKRQRFSLRMKMEVEVTQAPEELWDRQRYDEGRRMRERERKGQVKREPADDKAECVLAVCQTELSSLWGN